MPNNDHLLWRITARPDVFCGKPMVRDVGISAATVLRLLSEGVPREKLLSDYDGLEPKDILACIAYAHAVLAGEPLDAVSVAELPRRSGESASEFDIAARTK